MEAIRLFKYALKNRLNIKKLFEDNDIFLDSLQLDKIANFKYNIDEIANTKVEDIPIDLLLSYAELMKTLQESNLQLLKSRKFAIKNNLQMLNIDKLVSKYDYYFTNKQISQIQIVGDLIELRSFEQYYMAIFSNHVTIWDNNEIKNFDLPNLEDFGYSDIIYLNNGRFLIADYGEGIFKILDFITGKISEFDLSFDIQISVVKFYPYQDKLIICSDEWMKIYNAQTLDLENTFITQVIEDGITILPNGQIVTLNNEEKAVISFWDLNQDTPTKVINTTPRDDMKYQTCLRNIGNKLIIGFNLGGTLFIDENSIKPLDDNIYYNTQDILMNIITTKDRFMVIHHKIIVVYDGNGKKLKEIKFNRSDVSFLPNGNILFKNGKTITIYGNDNEYTYDLDTQFNSPDISVSKSGKLIYDKDENTIATLM